MDQFIEWINSTRIVNFDRYSLSDLYQRYLVWFSKLKYPFNKKYSKIDYSKFLIYSKSYFKTINNIASIEDEIKEENTTNGERLNSNKSEPRPDENNISTQRNTDNDYISTEDIRVIEKSERLDKQFTEQEVFEQVKNYVDALIDGDEYSLCVLGDSGLGKSYEIKERLLQQLGNESNQTTFVNELENNNAIPFKKEWIEGPSKLGPQGLYVTLYRENGRIIVFDECDSLFSNLDSVNLLKKVLDNKTIRKVSYGAKPILLKNSTINGEDYYVPTEFEFTGKVIFIANCYYKDIDKALLSRSLCVEVDLPNEEILKRIKRLLPTILSSNPKVTTNIKYEVLDYLLSISHLYKKLDLRTFEQSIRERLRTEKWKKLVAKSIQLKNK